MDLQVEVKYAVIGGGTANFKIFNLLRQHFHIAL